MDALLAGLKAAAEPTRLRLLALLARGELTVSELTRVLHQSQPRVSRHLKLLCDAGLLDRFPEGSWVFYRLAEEGESAYLTRTLLGLLPADDPKIARDLAQLDKVRHERSARAAAYFRDNAACWDRIRGLYVGEAAVERAMLEAAGSGELGELVDLGTGTGRVLEVFAARVRRGIGIDQSHEMLTIARAKLDARGITNCQVRSGSVYNAPLPSASADLVTIHHVLHFLDNPAAALKEAARLLRPGGRLLLVDFAPHNLEFLRTEHAHRRLGFADQQMTRWCKAAGLGGLSVRHLEAAGSHGHDTLTVSLWTATRPSSARSAAALARLGSPAA
ncbi:MAG: metalloregulator ArsR/SmtB family transcription factor [Deltaproteobacteria bacterium]|nr:metalloregulator ArsR/SmtB family transcription factor [Deltaproteobacteria bacterium]